jgi:LPS-assembly lipoprotein
MRAACASLAAATALSGCGLRRSTAAAPAARCSRLLAAVQVAPIEGQSGWLVANALRDRLGNGGESTPALSARGPARRFDRRARRAPRRQVARERRTLRARYQLVDLASGGVVLDATAGSDAGIDVVGSEYATIAAEKTALERLSGIVADQIIARVARYARARSFRRARRRPRSTQ